MEVCKNRTSGQYFIYVHETEPKRALLITPNAEIKSLQITLFAEIEEFTEEQLLASKMITQEQIRRFQEYKKCRAEDKVDDLDYYFDQLSPHEQLRFIQKLKKIFERNGIITQV